MTNLTPEERAAQYLLRRHTARLPQGGRGSRRRGRRRAGRILLRLREGASARRVRVGVIGTGDEGSVLIGALEPRLHRGQGHRRHPPLQPVPRLPRRLDGVPRSRPGLMSIYGWKSEARSQAAREGLRPLPGVAGQRQAGRHRGDHHRHAAAPARPDGHRRHEAGPARDHREAHGPDGLPVQGNGPRGRADRALPGDRPPAALQHPVLAGRWTGSSAACWATSIRSAPSGIAATCRRPTTTVGRCRCPPGTKDEEATRKLGARTSRCRQATRTLLRQRGRDCAPGAGQLRSPGGGRDPQRKGQAKPGARWPRRWATRARKSKTPPARSSTTARRWKS